MSQIEVQLEQRAYEPGEMVRGQVTWQAVDSPPEQLLITLLWYTEGKGTEDAEVHARTTIDHPRTQGSQSFDMRLPDFPWSFSGELISLIWAVEASLEPKGEVGRTDLIAAPGGVEVILQASS